MAANMERALPKFGEWDVNDPASAEGFSVIFNKARDEKRGGSGSSLTAPVQPQSYNNDQSYDHARPNKRWWWCCA